MREMKWIAFVFSFAWMINLSAQDATLLNFSNFLTATAANPAIPLEKTVNIGLMNYSVGLSTDGPVIDDLTQKNSEGKRYIDLKSTDKLNRDFYNIHFENDIRTLDLALSTGSFTWMAGHAFRSTADIRYSSDLIKVLSQGNAPFIGQTLQLGPQVNVLAYNELYLGVQKRFERLSLGIKAKVLFGTANVYTERSDMNFTTHEEYYQLDFNNDYLIRSSSLFRYRALDDITVNYQGFTFDNLFYNNPGFNVDVGLHYKVNDHFSVSAAALDIGSIKWDYSPRKYESKGSFRFDGVDIIDFLQDSTLEVKDTLLQIIDVTSSLEEYTTATGQKYIFGGSWRSGGFRLNAMYKIHNRPGYVAHQLSLAAVQKIAIFDVGLSYTVSKNDFASVGLYGGIHLKPIHVYLSAQNVLGVFDVYSIRNEYVSLGMALQF